MHSYKLLVTYNYLTHRETEYRRFMIQRWMPGMQALGFEPGEVMHTMWGEYPVRLIVLYARDAETINRIMRSVEWREWHEQLHSFVRNLNYRIVQARPWLQY